MQGCAKKRILKARWTKDEKDERIGHKCENIILSDLLTFHKDTRAQGHKDYMAHACRGTHLSSVQRSD